MKPAAPKSPENFRLTRFAPTVVVIQGAPPGYSPGAPQPQSSARAKWPDRRIASCDGRIVSDAWRRSFPGDARGPLSASSNWILADLAATAPLPFDLGSVAGASKLGRKRVLPRRGKPPLFGVSRGPVEVNVSAEAHFLRSIPSPMPFQSSTFQALGRARASPSMCQSAYP